MAAAALGLFPARLFARRYRDLGAVGRSLEVEVAAVDLADNPIYGYRVQSVFRWFVGVLYPTWIELDYMERSTVR